MASETPQQYTARILASAEGREPIEILQSTAGRLKTLMTGRSREELGRRPGPDRWSIAEIVTHLSDAEIVCAWRFRSVLASNAVPLQPYDQNAWATTFRYQDADPWLSLEVFDAVRRGTLALLSRVDRDLYDNYGLHAERGEESIAHLIRLYAGHDMNHLRQVERLIATISTSP